MHALKRHVYLRLVENGLNHMNIIFIFGTVIDCANSLLYNNVKNSKYWSAVTKLI